MSNALAEFHAGGGLTPADLNAKLARGRQNIPTPLGGDTLLRVDQNDGIFVYGADNVEVEEGSLWAVNPFSFKTGWVCWADRKMNGNKNEKLGEKMGPAENPIDEPALPDEWAAKGGSWVQQVGFDLVCISGEDEGTKVLFQNSSNGAIKAYEATYDAVMDRPSFDHCFPICDLKISSYMNKGYNKRIYEPVFEIVDWADAEQNRLSSGKPTKAKAIEQKAEPEAEEAPEAAGDETDAAPEAETQEAQPRRRRRRSAA